MTQPDQQHVPPVPKSSPNPDRAARIGQISPEGVPADPNAGPKTIGLVLAVSVVVTLGAAVILAAFVAPLAGVALGALALIVFLANPAVWASMSRAKERREID